MRTYSERPPEVRLVVQRGDGLARVVRLRSRTQQNARSTQWHTQPTARLGTQRCATTIAARTSAVPARSAQSRSREVGLLFGQTRRSTVQSALRTCAHQRCMWYGVWHTATVQYVLWLGRTHCSLAEYRRVPPSTASTAEYRRVPPRGDVARTSFASRG